MSREDVVAITVRLFAVFVFVLTLRQFAGLAQANALGALETVQLLVFALLYLVPVLLALLLWFFPLSVAHKLLPVMREPRSPALSAPSHLLQAVAFTVLGVWVLAGALPDVVYWVTLAVASRDVPIGSDFSPVELPGVLATVTECAIGIGLMLGAAGLSRTIRRLRYGASGGSL